MQNQAHTKPVYSIREFCEDHGIGLTFVYSEINAGRLRTMKAGRRRLITSEAAADYRELCEQLAREAAE